MKKFCAWVMQVVGGVAVCALASVAGATTYPGNGNTGFGGAIGQGSLALTDDGTTLSGTLTRGSGQYNDVLVLYIDSKSGGASDTSQYTDGSDGLRRAISGFDGGSNRSTLTFPSGFNPDYAFALGPQSDSFGGLFTLATNASFTYGTDNTNGSANLSPTGTNTAATYSFSYPLSLLSSGPNGSFKIFGTYISNTGYRSTEFIAGDGTSGSGQGYNAFTGTSAVTYSTLQTPEPASAIGVMLVAGGFLARRGRRLAR